uniref:Uncharacterized protein n=1 Tax=Acrobeloides nanus TaxID=290746 RepID=A0A914CU04_9BILA
MLSFNGLVSKNFALLVFFLILSLSSAIPVLRDFSDNEFNPRFRRADSWGMGNDTPMGSWSVPSFGFNYFGGASPSYGYNYDYKMPYYGGF